MKPRRGLTGRPEVIALHSKNKLEYSLVHARLEGWFRAGDAELISGPIPQNRQLIVDEQTSVFDGWLAVRAVGRGVELDVGRKGGRRIGPPVPR